MLNKLVTSGAIVAALSAGAVSSAQAQVRWDKAIYFTFDQPVTLPQTTLPAGRYLFRLADSLANRQIVQIYTADGNNSGKLAAMMMTLPVQRNDIPNDPELRFLETPANTPPAIATYWYPGEKQGWEFIYPREQASTLAKSAKQPVLTTKTDVSADEMKTASLVRVDPEGAEKDANANADAGTLAERTARGQASEAAPAAQASANSRASAQSSPSSDAAATARSAQSNSDVSASSPAPVAQAPRSTAMAQSTQTPPAPAARTSVNTPSAQNDASPAAARTQSSASADDTRTALPATASANPTIALVGVLALAAAVWLSRRTRVA